VKGALLDPINKELVMKKGYIKKDGLCVRLTCSRGRAVSYTIQRKKAFQINNQTAPMGRAVECVETTHGKRVENR
jgi:hypothetical protein